MPLYSKNSIISLGEAEIGSYEDMNLLAVDERHVDDFIEEDFNEERVDDCEAPPPPDVTSQDPEVSFLISAATIIKVCFC